MALPVIIDCDPGVDDALTLALAVASPELEIRAVTTVAGNAAVEVTHANAVNILALLRHPEIPVAAGASRPLVHAYEHGLPPPHGANGLGDVDLRIAPGPAAGPRALDLLREVLTPAAPRSITLIATAPLTNVALLAAVHPELLGRIRTVVVMGGSASRGNITPVAEFNTWYDPEAAQRVFTEAGLDLRLVGLDVTRRATLTPEHLDELRAASPTAAVLADMVLGYRDRNDDGWPIHDAVTVATLVDPGLITLRPALVEVDTGVGVGRGQTVFEFGAHEIAPRDLARTRYTAAGPVSVAVDLDVPGFRSLLLDRLSRT